MPLVLASHHLQPHCIIRTCTVTVAISMQGSCNGSYEEEIEQHDQPPLVPELAPIRPGQCVLYTDKVMFALAGNWTHELWLDNLFIRTHRLPNDQKQATQTVGVSAGTLWLSNVTLQSDDGPAQALLGFSSSRIHAEGAAPPPWLCPPVHLRHFAPGGTWPHAAAASQCARGHKWVASCIFQGCQLAIRTGNIDCSI